MNVDMILSILVGVLSIAIAVTSLRVFIGPSAADRIVALDILTTIGVSIAALYAAISGRTLYLDIAIILAVLSFISTVAAAYYLERKAKRNG
jgi:multicomponent Na+:H+ antiporter subunit F